MLVAIGIGLIVAVTFGLSVFAELFSVLDEEHGE